MAPTISMPTTTGLNVRVHERRVVADGVVAIELRAVDGYELSPFAAGSHIDVELPVRDAHGHFIVRQYSLCNDPAEDDRYVIGVGRDVNTRGGSDIGSANSYFPTRGPSVMPGVSSTLTEQSAHP